MTSPVNPTAASAVVGAKFVLVPGSGSTAGLLKALLMPALLALFASYLLIGIVTMKVPASATFPGPQFFPSLIVAGLYLFAVLIAIGAIRERRNAWRGVIPGAAQQAGGGDGDASGDGIPSEARTVRVDWASLTWVVGSFLVFSLVLPYLGWILAGALLFVCVARGFGSKRYLFSLLVGLTVSSLTYIGFDMLLGLSLPSGVLGWRF